nr:hypothetical protein [Nocardiopsis sinuspersici]
MGFAAVAGVIPTIEMTVYFGPGAGLVTGAVFIALVSLVAVHLYRARIILTAHEIILKGALFQRRRSRARAVWTIRATLVHSGGDPHDDLFVLDAHGGVLLRVYGANYTTEDMDRLVNALGLPCSGPEGRVTGKQLEEYRPGLVSWVEQHPFLFAAAFCVVLLLAIAVAVLIGVVVTMG